MMNIQNFKLAIRTLLKNKTTASINIVGLSVATIVSLLLLIVAFNENSTDSSLKNLKDIYVISESNDPAMSKPLSDLLVQQVPELGVVTLCNYEWSPQVFLKSEGTNFKVEKLLVADPNYFNVFQFPVLWGNPTEALQNNDQIVLTESFARKVFGDINPVGKTLAYNSTYLNVRAIQVGAVVKDLSQNSSWEFDAVLPIAANLKLAWYNNLYKSWGAYNYCAFARLNEGSNPKMVQEHLKKIDLSAMPESNRDSLRLSLTPFKSAYFDLPSIDELKHGNKYVNLIIQIIAILILLLACVNYVSMVTAQREKWVKTIGIVRSLGSSKNKVIAMIMAESSIILMIVLSIVLIVSPLFYSWAKKSFDFNVMDQSIFYHWNTLILFGIIAFVWLITGLVPGYILSKHETTLLLKRLPTNQAKSGFLKNGLLVFQFSVSIILLSGIFIIERQNRLISNNNPGFQKDHIIVASTNKDIQTKIQAFKNGVRSISGIVDFTFTSEPLGNIHNNTGTTMTNQGNEQQIGFVSFWVSPNFFNFFGIKSKSGIPFQENSKENNDFIFNEKAIEEFNIGKIEEARVHIDKNPAHGQVIGVVENFNFKSLHVPIGAAGFQSAGEAEDIGYFKILATNGEAFKETMSKLEKVWNELSPNYPFEYTFLDRSWEELYKSDIEFQRLIKYAAIISILLSCIGLVGLSYYVMETKTKEIGIRKVNGARVSEVMGMLNKGFAKRVAIAFLIATPIAWYAMNRWLENFAYKTALNWWIFALAGLLALGIALLTVSWQSWKAATRNPVEALRYE